MSTAVLANDAALLAAVERHLDLQIESGRRLLDQVLRQGAAIRERDTEAVLARLGEIKLEMAARETLEQDRSALISRLATRLGVPPGEVTLAALRRLLDEPGAAAVEARSSELRGLLGEIAREHGINRALMRQELTFLDHLIRVVGDPVGAGGPHRLMDVEA